jgi:acyl carrier protein
MSIMSATPPAAAPHETVAMNVRSLIAKYLGIDAQRVSDESRFVSDLGADWLDRLELMIMVEEQFAIEFADDDLDRLVAVGDLIRFIEDHQQLKITERRAS